MRVATFIFRWKFMKKDARIDIESIVEELDDAGLVESSDKTTSSAIGTLEVNPGKTVIAYSETIENATSDAEIIISDSEITVKRNGSSEYEFIFIEGKSTKSLYTVAPYSFDTEIYTRKIRNSFDECGGEISLIYDMTIGGAKKKTRMKIRVSEK